MISNSDNVTVYVSETSNVSASLYDIIIPPYGTRVYAKPVPMESIFFFAGATARLFISMATADFDFSMIAQTQEIAGNPAAGIMGIVDIRSIINPLPAGTNLLGFVAISSLPSLPAGVAGIGSVIVTALPSLPAGTNNIGDMDVLTLPALNTEGTALASAARTATIQSADLPNNFKNGLILVIDVTAIGTAPSITVAIEGKDLLSGKYYQIIISVAITAVGTTILKVFPAATAAANLVANDIIPKTWRVNVIHANADSITYSIGHILV
jgi:hypothetical protein